MRARSDRARVGDWSQSQGRLARRSCLGGLRLLRELLLCRRKDTLDTKSTLREVSDNTVSSESNGPTTYVSVGILSLERCCTGTTLAHFTPEAHHSIRRDGKTKAVFVAKSGASDSRSRDALVSKDDEPVKIKMCSDCKTVPLLSDAAIKQTRVEVSVQVSDKGKCTESFKLKSVRIPAPKQ